MVTLVWGGGEGVLGEGSPPPLVLNYSKEALGVAHRPLLRQQAAGEGGWGVAHRPLLRQQAAGEGGGGGSSSHGGDFTVGNLFSRGLPKKLQEILRTIPVRHVV